MAASPATISEKKTPIESTVPAFWKVARMPDAAPRWLAGTLVMIAARVRRGEQAPPMPLTQIRTANDR